MVLPRLILERNIYYFFCFRIQDMMHLLTDILNTLNKIWTQSDWEDEYMRYTYCLSRLYGNDQFRRTVYSLVKSFEELLVNRILKFSGEGPSESTDYVYLSTLLKLMLPLILRVNRYRQHIVSLSRC